MFKNAEFPVHVKSATDFFEYELNETLIYNIKQCLEAGFVLGAEKINKQFEELLRADWSTAVSPESRSKGQVSNDNFTLTPIILFSI